MATGSCQVGSRSQPPLMILYPNFIVCSNTFVIFVPHATFFFAPGSYPPCGPQSIHPPRFCAPHRSVETTQNLIFCGLSCQQLSRKVKWWQHLFWSMSVFSTYLYQGQRPHNALLPSPHACSSGMSPPFQGVVLSPRRVSALTADICDSKGDLARSYARRPLSLPPLSPGTISLGYLPSFPPRPPTRTNR